MLPEALARNAIEMRSRVPRYLDERDHAWLRDLLELYRTFAGGRRGDLDVAIQDFVSSEGHPARIKRAVHVLDALVATRVRAIVDPRTIRSTLFARRAPYRDRAQAVRDAAKALEIAPAQVDEWLFADFAKERVIDALPETLGPQELALRANLALVQGFVARSDHVRIRADGGVRDLVRHAKLVGLMCSVCRPPGASGSSELDISGPLVLFGPTRIYARALASIVPRLVWAKRFELETRTRVDHRIVPVRIGSGDPIFPSIPPRVFDSKVEARFAKEFVKQVREFELLREPGPIDVDGTLVFPDFVLRHRADPNRVFLLEIIGFWTSDYLERKVSLLRRAKITNLVLCIDRSLASADGQPPIDGARVVWFRKKVPVGDVVAALSG